VNQTSKQLAKEYGQKARAAMELLAAAESNNVSKGRLRVAHKLVDKYVCMLNAFLMIEDMNEAGYTHGNDDSSNWS